MSEEEHLSFQEIIDIIARFLEAGIHTILCIRQVYPADLFERRKLYDVPIWRSRHPQLTSYIAQVVDHVVEELAKGKVDKAVVAIKDGATDNVLEHHVFDFAWLNGASIALYATEADRKRRPLHGVTHGQVDLLLRAFLLKISSLDSQLVDLPPDTTFIVFIEAPPDGPPPTEPDPESGEVPPWVPEQAKLGDQAQKHVPVRSANFGVLQMQLYVEETEAKLEMERTKRQDVKGKGRAI